MRKVCDARPVLTIPNSFNIHQNKAATKMSMRTTPTDVLRDGLLSSHQCASRDQPRAKSARQNAFAGQDQTLFSPRNSRNSCTLTFASWDHRLDAEYNPKCPVIQKNSKGSAQLGIQRNPTRSWGRRGCGGMRGNTCGIRTKIRRGESVTGQRPAPADLTEGYASMLRTSRSTTP